MKSIEKEFYDDVRSKKQLASAARHKKNGSRSKKCTLPSDSLTNKQLRERNGDTIVYNLTKPMKWSDFKRLPDHAQEEYLSFLNNNFGATATDIAKMFGVVANTVLKYIESKKLDIQFRRGQRMSSREKEDWENFLMDESIPEQLVDCEIQGAETKEFVSDNVETNMNDEDKIPNLILKSDWMKMSEITLRFDGVIDVNSIANTLKVVLGNNSNGCLLISYTRNGINESEESAI